MNHLRVFVHGFLIVFLSQGCLSSGARPDTKEPLPECIRVEDACVTEDRLVVRMLLSNFQVAVLDVEIRENGRSIQSSLREGTREERDLSGLVAGIPIQVSNDYAWLDALSPDTPAGTITKKDEIELCWDDRPESIQKLYILNKARQLVAVIKMPKS